MCRTQLQDGIYAKVQLIALLSQLMEPILLLLEGMVRPSIGSLINFFSSCTPRICHCYWLRSLSNVGYLRVFDYKNEQLICGGKSYYGALLCCAWRLEFLRDFPLLFPAFS